MDLYKYFSDIRNILLTNENLWRHEVLNEYPTSLEMYDQEFVKEIRNLNSDDKYRLDAFHDESVLKKGKLKDLIIQLQKLSNGIPKQRQIQEDFPRFAFVKVNKKKKHELQSLCPYIGLLNKDKKYLKAIDVGGGVGHLSRFLAHYYQIEAFCIDMDSSLQNTGENRIDKYSLPPNAKNVNFRLEKFPSKSSKYILDNQSLVLGLHSCGNLSNHLLKSAVLNQAKTVINFGCCYLKMDAKKDFPISKFAKDGDPINLCKYSLTLATRSHASMTRTQFENKKQVKFYRYGLHLFLYYKMKRSDFVSIGDAKTREYYLPFSQYVKSKLIENEIECPLKAEEIDAFYKSTYIQNKLEDMFCANIIRWQFGRCLELAILLDRAIYLSENGRNVEIKEFFNPDLSPRNIGIVSHLL
ncbi:MAG: methyltransferase [Halobacteriovoraceae bacterium]|nr:methyltransferase [Halobacteriovoraceae bacterium]